MADPSRLVGAEARQCERQRAAAAQAVCWLPPSSLQLCCSVSRSPCARLRLSQRRSNQARRPGGRRCRQASQRDLAIG